MTKRFYVVVPYDPVGDRRKGFWPRLKALFAPTTILHLEEQKFQERRDSLMRRVGQVMQGLRSMGLTAALMNTENLIELFYETYNPLESATQPLEELHKMNVVS
jgi:hypothetical protein